MREMPKTVFALFVLFAFEAVADRCAGLSGFALSSAVQAAEGSDTALHAVARDGQVQKVASLIADGADVNAKDASGRTPLHLAAAGGHQLTCQALIEAGADINAKDSKGATPLDLAKSGGHSSAAAFLVEKGAVPGAALSLAAQAAEGAGTALHAAARDGETRKVVSLIADGADINAKDASGRTPLHLAAAGGHQLTCQALIEAGADINAKDSKGATPLDLAKSGGHSGAAAFLVEKGAVPGAAPAEAASETPSPDELPTGTKVRPDAPFPTAEAYSKALGEPGVLIDGEHVMVFAPKRREREAGIIAGYLRQAYDKLYSATGIHTKYKMIVYHFPDGSEYGWGGTSECVIWYGNSNLALEKQAEWTLHKVPHVSGYIEEMAHNFRDSAKIEFGWEGTGWLLGAEVTAAVAGNPVHTREVREALASQLDTYQRYRNSGNRLPADIPSNCADRINIYLLCQCEDKYGPTFWQDFFKEVRAVRPQLAAAAGLGSLEATRNERYRLTVECFDRLPGLEFKKMLEENGISTTVEIKSLATKPDWDRRYK